MPFFAPVSSEEPLMGWPQFACDVEHSSIALDTWDFNLYRTPAWTLTIKGTESYSRNPVVDKGVMIIADTERVYCQDVISGKQRWATDLFGECGGSCAIIDDKVLVPLRDKIVLMDLTTGEPKSSLETGSNPSSPSFYKDDINSFFYFSTGGKPGTAVKFNLGLGRTSWQVKTEWGAPGGLGVNVEQGLVGIPSHYTIECADESTGSFGSTLEVNTQSFSATSAIGDYCVFTMSGGEIYLLPKPYERWNPQIIDVGGFTFWPPARFGEKLIEGNQDGRVVCFDVTGKIAWDVKMSNSVTGGCTIMGEKVLVPVGGSDKTKSGVYILDASNGNQLDFINIQAEVVFQPVVAWRRMFVEYGKNDRYATRYVSCFGKKPRTADQEPKLEIKNGKFDVEVGWMSEILRQITLVNTGKVSIDLLLTGENLLQPTVDTITIAPGTTETLRVKVLGKNRPGKYQAKINCHVLDPDYGDRSLGYITANITIKDSPPPPPPEQPPNPPQNLQARVVYDYIQLEWKAPDKGAEPIGYNIFRTVGNDPFSKTPVNKEKITDLTYADKEVIPGLKYSYRAVALGKGGLVSDPSNVVSAEVPIKLVAVKNLTVKPQGEGVLLSWESEQPVSFLVERDGSQIGMTTDHVFADSNPPKTKIIYKVYPTKDSLIGPEAFTIIDLTPEQPEPEPNPEPNPNPDPTPNPPPEVKKTIIEFTAGMEIATVNGVAKFSGASPYISGGRLMVPFRFLGESLGAKVDFTTDPKTTKVVTVTYLLAGIKVTLVMGSKIASVGENTVELDVPPEIKDGRTYVPLRFVTAALGGDVAWNATEKKATITYPK